MILLADEAEKDAAISQLEAGGYVAFGSIPSFDAWREAGLPVDAVVAVPVESLAGAANGHQYTIIDVREPMEWETGYVPGAVLVPLGRLPREIPSLDVDARVAVICEAGIRSSTASSLLKRAGFGDVGNVLAGTSGYRRAGLPLAFTVGP
jgi:rhodanese-related sulfurtransferase